MVPFAQSFTYVQILHKSKNFSFFSISVSNINRKKFEIIKRLQILQCPTGLLFDVVLKKCLSSSVVIKNV
jgi:hypothetical protein